MKSSGGELASQAEDFPGQTPEAGEGRRGRGRGRPDLSALFAEVDDQSARQPHMVRQSPLERLANLGMGEAEAAGPAQQSAPGPTATVGAAGAGDRLPPELQRYLSPELWRKLNSPEPPRGVLINALERMRSVQYLLGTFLPAHLVQEKMRRPFAGQMSAQVLHGTLLFSDVSGFTALSERLAALGAEGAEVLTNLMNRYFAAMLEVLAWSGGILLKFAGDALLVWFPAGEEVERLPASPASQSAGGEVAPHSNAPHGNAPHGNAPHASQALRAAQRMLRLMSSFAQLETPAGAARLTMKIGLATGQFLAVSAGTPERMEYFVLGPAVSQVMAAEGASSGGGQIVLNREAAAALGRLSLPEARPGFYLLERGAEQGPLDDFEILPETRRARGAIPWNATPQAILAQVEVALRQVLALQPYLPPELVERVLAPGRGRQLQSEYRQATVMFVNFIGPEAAYARWGEPGATRAAALLQAFFTRVQTVVQRYGGMISRVDPYSRGTKMLILFGVPTAHEDDAQRAVSAALAMQNELPAIEEAWRRKYSRYLEGVPELQSAPLLQMRIGITFGQTFAGQVGSSTRREYTVMGDDVNLAARLMGAAEYGRILINPAVQERVQGLFVLTERPPLKVKGKTQPITVYQVEGPREDTLAERRQRRGPLIGRQEALARGWQAIQEALDGRGGLLIIQGPAGSGKSHLADELLRRSEAPSSALSAPPPGKEGGLRWFEVQCRSFQSDFPYAAWSRLMRSLAGITTLDLLPAQRAVKLRRLMAELQLDQAVLPALAALLGLSEAEVREDLSPEQVPAAASVTQDGSLTDTFAFVRRGEVKRRGSQLEVLQQLDGLQKSAASADALGATRYRLLAELDQAGQQQLRQALWAVLAGLTGSPSAPRPTAIFFEDAHWMDAASRRLLEELAPQLQTLPLLILCAQRSENAAYAAPALLAMRSEATSVITLGPLSAAETEALVAHLLVSDLSQVIYAQTQGAPLLVDEVTRWFKRTHRLDPQELQEVLQASDILQKLILSGLEALPEATRQVARVAAVISAPAIGAEFRTSEVQALLGEEMDPVSLSQHLRALARGGWIALNEAGADAGYHFQQALTREVLYNSLPHEQRRQLHARLAAYLEAQLQPESELEGSAARRRLQARLMAALGGERLSPERLHALIAFHYEQAEDWLAAARHLVAAGQQAERSSSWRLRQAAEGAQSLLTAGGHFQRALELLPRLPEANRGADWAEALVQAWLGVGDVAFWRGDELRALTAYENALQADASQSPLPAGETARHRLPLTCRLALVMALQRRAPEAVQRLAAQIEAGGEAAARWLPAALTLTWLLWRQGEPRFAEWLEQAQAGLQPEMESETGRLWTAILRGLAGEWRRAAQDFLELDEGTGLAIAYLHHGEAELQQGRPTEARSYFQLAETIWRSWPGGEAAELPGRCRALALYQQARVHLAQAEAAVARQLLEQALQALEQEAPCLQADGRSAVQAALKSLAAQKDRFPDWDWRSYEDTYYARQLFVLLHNQLGAQSALATNGLHSQPGRT